MLKTIWLKTIRDNWRAIAALGLGVGALFIIEAATYFSVYPTIADRLKAEAQMKPLLSTVSFLIGPQVDVTTLGGWFYLEVFSFVPLLLGIWAIMTATGITRGEEGSGAADILLTTPESRSSVLLQKWLGFSLSLLAIGIIVWLAIVVSYLAFNEPLDLAASLLAALNLAFIAWLWGCVGLVFAQLFNSRGAAAGITAGLMVTTYFLNTLAGQLDSTRWASYLSPFHFYTVNRPLASGFSFDPFSFMVVPLLALDFTALAVYLFTRRDIGAALGLRKANLNPTARIVPLNWHEQMMGSVFTKTLRDLRWPTFWWALGLAAYCGYVVGLGNQYLDVLKNGLLKDSSVISKMLGNMVTVQDFLAYTIFAYVPVMIAAFAITQIAGWTGEEESGRLETLLATPQPRWQVLLSRFAAVVVASLVIVLVVGLMIALTGAAASVSYDAGKMWSALLSLLPLSLLVVAVGYAIAAWLKRPGAAVAIVSVYVAAAFLLSTFLNPIFNLPGYVNSLSVFYQYGTPAQSGLDVGSVVGLSGAALVLLALAIFGFQRRDVAKA
ncbi:MAG: hypothetical protein DLM69_01850 [Candidatus Chloroheliales bacterium]|nr:MAG: hypothetical protein DLM69_01850 [Chloroflexota bacterium]